MGRRPPWEGSHRGRPAPADAGDDPAGGERRPLQQGGGRHRPGLEHRGRRGAALGPRHGPGHPARGADGDFRPLPPRLQPEAHRGRGARPRHRQGDRRGPSRPGRTRERTGRRLDLHNSRTGRPTHRGGKEPQMTKILIAEDEDRITSFLEKGLRANGFNTEVAPSGDEALRRARTEDFDLLILDLGLPGKDGIDVLRELRGEGRPLPVVILSARDRIGDTVSGLDWGADDYITKPFRFDELLARVRVRLRTERPYEPTVLEAGDAGPALRTPPALVGGAGVALSARGFALAEVFFRHPGQVLGREQLLSQVWGYDYDPSSNIIDVYVGYLRRKLGRDRIESVRGLGYRLVPITG